MKRLVYILFFSTVLVAIIVTGVDLRAQSSESSLVAVDSTLTSSDSINASPSKRSNRRPYISPVNNAATRTQYQNDAAGDSARMLERRRQRSIHYHDENGNVVMVDTVTGQEWVDSTLVHELPKMKQPLWFSLETAVNIWDPVMRLFGQKYGIIDFSVGLNLHNRYIPTIEVGVGTANDRPEDMNYTYKSSVAPYFKLGADYNFIYNSNPAYRFTAGLRYGFSAFSYQITDVTLNNTYWGETAGLSFPRQNVFAGWAELVAGVRVHISGPISLGWMLRYKLLLHQTHPSTGDAWYIPGFGSVNANIGGSFSVYYDISLDKKRKLDLGPATDVGNDADALHREHNTRPPRPETQTIVIEENEL